MQPQWRAHSGYLYMGVWKSRSFLFGRRRTSSSRFYCSRTKVGIGTYIYTGVGQPMANVWAKCKTIWSLYIIVVTQRTGFQRCSYIFYVIKFCCIFLIFASYRPSDQNAHAGHNITYIYSIQNHNDLCIIILIMRCPSLWFAKCIVDNNTLVFV